MMRDAKREKELEKERDLLQNDMRKNHPLFSFINIWFFFQFFSFSTLFRRLFFHQALHVMIRFNRSHLKRTSASKLKQTNKQQQELRSNNIAIPMSRT